MKIVAIQLKNIKSHRDRKISFAEGINVLAGPNGIGKSTIFEAIGYALFGVDAQSFVGNVERFVSIGAKKGEVQVEFEPAAESRFLVSRTVGTPSKWLLSRQVAGDYEVEEHKDGKETEARLKELLGLDNGRSLAEQFELVIGPFQHDFLGPFVIKQAAKRRDRFDEILGIDTWRKTFNETKHLGKAIEAKIVALQCAIAPLQDQLEQLPGKLEQQQQVIQDQQATEKLFAEKQQLFQQLQARLSALEQTEKALNESRLEREALSGRIASGKEMIQTQQQAVAEAEKSQQILRESEAAKQAYEQAEQQLFQLRGRLQIQRQLEQESAQLNARLGSLSGQFSAETAALEQAERELQVEQQRLKTERSALQVEPELKKIAEQLPEFREAIKSLQTQLGQLSGRKAGLEEGSEKLAAGACPFFQEPCRNIADKPPEDVFSAKFKQLDDERQRLQKQLDELLLQEAQAQQADQQIKQLLTRQQALDAQIAGFESKWQGLEKRKSARNAISLEQQNLQQQLALKQQELAGYADLQAEMVKAEQVKQDHQQARDLFVAHQQQATELEKRQQDLLKFTSLLAQLEAELTKKQSANEELAKTYDSQQHQQIRSEIDALNHDIGSLGQKLNTCQQELQRLQTEIERLKQYQQEIETKQGKIRDYRDKEQLVKFLRSKVFRNVSAYLSERFRQEISLRADRIYRTIAEVDEELCWGDNYQIVLRDMVAGEIRERIDDQLSGGQIMSAVVALRLALLQTIGARIAFFDEPTSNLDATRRENLARAFRAIDVGREEVTEHWYDQLFLISHDVAFTEVTDQIIMLE
jgi:exonuclease SbcC